MKRPGWASMIPALLLVSGLLLTGGGAAMPVAAGGPPPVPCPPGAFSENGWLPCDPAPAGSYVDVAGSTSAAPCAAGSFSATEGSSACTLAPAGFFAAGLGNILATICPDGTTSNVGAAACTPIVISIHDAIDAAAGADTGLAKALHKKAASISSAPNAKARAGKLNGFIKLVEAQRGKALTSADAALLIGLARDL